MLPMQIGDEFGQLKVISLGRKQYGKKWYTTAICLCNCGNPEPREVLQKELRGGRKISCKKCSRKRVSAATIKKSTKHGGCGSRLYNIWVLVRKRCYNPRCDKYKYYGGKGITVCTEWLNSFESFRDWALANGYENHLTIERTNNDLGYEPTNCKWVTAAEQKLNMTSNVNLTAFGETKTVSQWADDKRCPVSANTLYQRVEKNWPHEKAITKPSIQKKTRSSQRDKRA